MPDVRHSIKVVSKRTGLSPHVIRVWEKRYNTVCPGRSDGGRRLYRSDDIERLRLLKRAIDSGHSIGDIAHLQTDRLRRLLAEDQAHDPAAPNGHGNGNGNGNGNGAAAHPDPAESPAALVADAMKSVEAMNAEGLAAVLDRGAVALGQLRLLSDVVVPLVGRLGDGWRDGSLKIAHEHVATAVLRTQLGQLARPCNLHPAAPAIVVTTPAGQSHEIGAILAAAVARAGGWRVVYAGASLPAEEIASAARAQGAAAVALSIVHPSDDPEMAGELRRLRRLLPPRVHLLAGGRAAVAYAEALASCGATVVRDLDQLSAALERLRSIPA